MGGKNYCAVDSCLNKIGGELSFFRFPRDDARCQEWKDALGFTGNHRYANVPANQCHVRIKICSLHFTEKCFVKQSTNRIYSFAVPSLNLTAGEDVKKKWKNMRDTYSKHLKSASTSTNQGSKKNNTEWQWSRQMEFLKPFLACTKAIPNNPNENFEEMVKDIKEEIVVNESLFSDDSHSSNTAQPPLTDIEPSTSSNQSKKKPISKDSPVDRVIQFLSTRRPPASPELDAIEHLFMGFAKTVKTFSPKRQALAKMKIAQIVSEQELLHLDELANQQCSFLPPPPDPGDSNGVDCDENIDYEDMKVSPRGSPVPMDDYRLHEDDYLDSNIKPDIY